MQTVWRTILRFVPALVAALGLGLGPTAWAGERATAAAAAAEASIDAEASIPIELPEGPAEPRPEELVGGYHGWVIFWGIVVFVAVVVAVADAAYHSHHHHHVWDGCQCEKHWHHGH